MIRMVDYPRKGDAKEKPRSVSHGVFFYREGQLHGRDGTPDRDESTLGP